MKLRKTSATVLALLMTVSLLVSCNRSEDTPTPTAQGQNQNTENGERQPLASKSENWFKYGTTGFDGVLNPIMFSNQYDNEACNLMFESLVVNTPDGEAIPGNICESYTLSDDHLTYTFKLKDGVKFWDGEQMTAEDVEFTYKTMSHPDYDGPRSYDVYLLAGYDEYHSGETDEFTGIKVIDELTISFTFADDAASPVNIWSFGYGILPKHYYDFENYRDFTALNDKPLGSGPFIFDSWAAKEHIRLPRNDNYWDKANGALIAGVLFRYVPQESLIPALESGEIDLAMPQASKDNLELIKASQKLNLITFLSNSYTFLCFNTTLPKLSDVRVRQALMYALDRKNFIKIQYGEELGSIGLAPVSPVSWAFPDVSELDAYDFNMDKAGKLMDDAGWLMGSDGYRYKDGEKFTITWLVYTESAWPGTLSELAFDSWKQLGVDLKIELMDFNTVSSRTMDAPVESKNFDIYTMGFQLSIDPDPTGALFDYDAYTEGGFNASGYYNERSQELITLGRNEFDTDKRAEIYQEWAKLMNEEIPTVIVAYRNELWTSNIRVKNLEIGTYTVWTDSMINVYFE